MKNDEVIENAKHIAEFYTLEKILREGEFHYDTFEDRLECLLFIGTVFGLVPSGKYYTPFACGNVTPCPRCAGRGVVGKFDRRKRKKWNNARKKARTKEAWLQCQHNIRRFSPVTCPYCEGVGSREALEDEIWWETLEENLAPQVFHTCGEGDPCDIFVGVCYDIDRDDDIAEALALYPELQEHEEQIKEIIDSVEDKW